MLLRPLKFHFDCNPCFETITEVQETRVTQKKKETILPQLKLPSTSCLYKANVSFYASLKSGIN